MKLFTDLSRQAYGRLFAAVMGLSLLYSTLPIRPRSAAQYASDVLVLVGFSSLLFAFGGTLGLRTGIGWALTLFVLEGATLLVPHWKPFTLLDPHTWTLDSALAVLSLLGVGIWSLVRIAQNRWVRGVSNESFALVLLGGLGVLVGALFLRSPNERIHLHHYQVGVLLGILSAAEGIPSQIVQGVALGLLSHGLLRYGADPLVEPID